MSPLTGFTPQNVELRFAPEPYSRKMELNSSGKIHCKVAGGVSPTIQWYLNDADPLPDGVTSANGTLMVSEASKRHAGLYTCKAVDGDKKIESKITLDVVVSPRITEPVQDQNVQVTAGQDVVLNCVASGDPPPTMQWDKNSDILTQIQNGVANEASANASTASVVLLNNGSLLLRNVSEKTSAHYGCTAGSAAGLVRHELLLTVAPRHESNGVAGKAVVVSISVAGAYMVLVLALMVYCRRRRLKRRQRGEKMELEMVEGREKLVEDGETDAVKVNGGPAQNGRLLPHEKDSGPDNSEVSRASKKSGNFERLSLPRTLLTDPITLGRGEFGEVLLAKIDMSQVAKLRKSEGADAEPNPRPVLVKSLTTKDEVQLAEFRRQLDVFGRARHSNVVALIGLCSEMDPHYMLLEHTDWGDLKSFLLATRGPDLEEEAGASSPRPPALRPPHLALLAAHLAAAAAHLAGHRLTHRDIAARNCLITSKLQLKLSCPALTRGPLSREYYKLHDQVIPLRWCPLEVVLEGDYSTKSDVYMYAATVWEMYTQAELPFAKLNDSSVLDRLKTGALEWSVPASMPQSVADILKRCWSQSPTDRPQFAEVCEEINTVLQETTSENASTKSQKTDEDN
ncbi:tyrosine-protein kinase-like otk [Bombyx mandarina]|uniref:Tyrosine-protein kinase-like otk n=1 Tax=Bombyx mandarina TaxID=7092 RepID=A0A6J2JEA9_BOMMA|nr:tyrosine-protein kinase-like otk [Bombyx mandarina]